MDIYRARQLDTDFADDFPEHAPAVEQYAFLLRYIVYAAMRGVGVTWLPTVGPDGIAFTFVNTASRLRADDGSHATRMEIGQALMALRLAMRRFGRLAEVRLFPDPAHPDIVAHLAFGALHCPTLDDYLRFNALTAPLARSAVDERRELPQGLLHAVPHLMAQHGVWAAAVAEARDRIRVHDCMCRAIHAIGTADCPGVIEVTRDELVSPFDVPVPGLFVLGAKDHAPARNVALGEALQELVVLLRLNELRARVVRLGQAQGQPILDTLALPSAPRFVVAAAYSAAHRER